MIIKFTAAALSRPEGSNPYIPLLSLLAPSPDILDNNKR
jgi:hypothetical protein